MSRLKLTTSVFALFCLISVPAVAADVVGSASGVFWNPTPLGTVFTGDGTSNFLYGDNTGQNSPQNQLTFTGSSFSGAFETPFKVGSLFYFNGTTGIGTNPTAVDLVLSTNFSTPSLPIVTSTFGLSLIVTPNTGDPNGDADFVVLPSTFSPTVFDIGGTNYTVKLMGFDNVVGDGFLESSGTQLHVREGLSATADLFAEVTTDISGGVPEPSTWAMMILGFAGVGFMAYRRKTTPSALMAA
jgi:hypothetical protein